MKNLYFYLFTSIISFLLISCQQENFESNELSETTQSIANDETEMCLSDFYDSYYEETESNDLTRGVILKNNKWENGTIIRVKFLNGDVSIQNKIKKYAKEWSMHANIKFLYVSADKDADIKIGICFNGDKGNWSMSGVRARRIAQNMPSINFGFTSNSKDSYIKGNVLHEFGHALGLRHEHLHPKAGIKWNKPAVYKHFIENRGWTKEGVDKNLFSQVEIQLLNYGIYDKHSIMHYRIDKSWTLDGFEVPSNPNPSLSVQDKIFIAKEYPYTENTKGLYRCYNKSQYYYISNTEDFNNDYVNLLGRIFHTQIANTHPIYKYYNISNGDRLLTRNWNELQNGSTNWKYEGIFGYAYTTKQPNTSPVYRYKIITPKHTHLYSFSGTMASDKLQLQGILLYALNN